MTKEKYNKYLEAENNHQLDVRLQIERGIYAHKTLEIFLIVLVFTF